MSAYSQVAQYDSEESYNRSSSTSTDLEYDEEFEVLVNAFLKDMDYTSTSQAVFNIVYSIINSGLIALPFACYLAGIPTFIAIVGGISLISGYVSIMVIAMANEQRVRTLEDLAQCAFGPNGFILVCALQMIFSFSLMVVTLSIFAEIMSDVFSETSIDVYFLTHRHGQVLIGAVMVLPLCILKKSMSSLRWTSYFTVMVIAAALVGVVTVYVTDVDTSDTASTKRVDTPKDASWSALLIVIFCYSYNQKVFMIYSCLRRRTADRWGVAVKRANLIISVLYIVFGTFGYVSRDRIGEPMDHHDYFIDNRDENKVVFDVARVMVAFCLLLTIPVDCLVSNTTFRRIAGRYTNSKFEKKLNKHLCCKGWWGSSKGSDTGSFNSRDEEDGQPRTTSEDLLIASRQSKPRSASGSKKYQRHNQSGSGATGSTSSSSLSGAAASSSSSVPVSIVKKGSLPTESVPIPAPDVSGSHSGFVGSIYRSLLMTPPQPTVTEINTNLNSIQNENIIQEALSHSYENTILKRLSSSKDQQQGEGSYNVGMSYNSNSSMNAEIVSSLHQDHEESLRKEQLQQSRPRDGSGLSADLEPEEDRDQFKVDGLRERGSTGGASSPLSPSKRSVSFINDSGRGDSSLHQALLHLEDPYDQERKISSGVNSADGVKMTYLTEAAAAGPLIGSDSNALVNSGTQSGGGRQTSGGSQGSGGSGSGNNPFRKDHHSNEGMVRIHPGAGAGGSTHTIEDLERSFSAQGGDWVKPKAMCPTWSEVWPALVLWAIMTVIAFLVEEWLILATVATIATVILLFVLPTMFYFRLGLASDFQAIPYCGVVPNRFYMMTVQFVGIGILLYELVALLYNLIMMGRVIHHKHN